MDLPDGDGTSASGHHSIRSKGPVFMHALFRRDPGPAVAPRTPARPPLTTQPSSADIRRPAGEWH